MPTTTQAVRLTDGAQGYDAYSVLAEVPGYYYPRVQSIWMQGVGAESAASALASLTIPDDVQVLAVYPTRF